MRDYVEVIHSPQLPWQPAPAVFAGAHWKRLSHDPDSGACTALLRWPPGRAALPQALSADWEYFVLRGELRIGAQPPSGMHYYAYLPAGLPLGGLDVGAAAMGAPAAAGGSPPGTGEAILLCFFSRAPQSRVAGHREVGREDARVTRGDPAPFDASRLIGPVDTTALRWDSSGIDPNINHLNAARKNLRFAPEGDCRSYLLGGMPQGFPYEGASMERHPHGEEFFVVSGDMACHVGILRAGAYFNRPADIAHGRDCTRTGYLLFCRTPGSNRTVTAWTDGKFPVLWNPPHQPVLPPEFALAGARPVVDPLEY